MKKILLILSVLGCASLNTALAGVEQYVAAVDQISEQYKRDSRNFFSSLNAQQTSFTPEQQTQYCAIVGRYIDRLYQAADQNRAFLDRQFRQMTRQDVINQVMSSREMLILKKYNIQCELK
ncbi:MULTISPECIES: hypothetical protein [unclassified Acinetobacter]|uniref:hypothetical protein n=1 Tax=unclassified Acinetobacter TaxID=196816 RepID=UPI00120F7380|nr:MULTISPECIES: hypothetical protein [unclassified Acinetobacter]RZJ22514.1 MAG: hypothetical protein EON51_07320 [Acinetobacter sp.]